MKFLSRISDDADTLRAVDTLVGDVALAFKGPPDVLFVFFTAAHADKASEIARRLHEQLEPKTILGCSAEGVIGFDREIENAPAIAILAGQMPDVRLHAFHIHEDSWREVIPDEAALRAVAAPHGMPQACIAVGDPYTTPAIQLLKAVDTALPGMPLIGGMASAGQQPGENQLILDDQVFTTGLVGLSITGRVDVGTVVSQGCRPVGRTFVITKGKDNVIETLGGRPALQVIQEVVQDLDPREHALLENGLFVGRVIDEYRENFGRGDFLVRGVMRVNQSNGAIAITDYVRAGQTVQFHVRDAQTADEDLNDLLLSHRPHSPAGGLLFSCNGRGTRMFEEPSHDIGVSQKVLPATPVAGFFAAGELGPVGGRNFIHGHTASFAFFRSL